MTIIKEEFELRKNEIETYFEFLNNIYNGYDRLIDGDGKFFRINQMTHTMQKSNFILILYNIVESIVTKILERIHIIIISDNLKYNELNPKIKKLILSYYLSIYDKKANNSVEEVFELCELFNQRIDFSLTFEELKKHYSLYSGNLDSKKINTVINKYGICIDLKVSELQTIKDLRNKLAHGEESFEECGRNISLPQLIVLKDRTINFLEDLISNVEMFIDERKYVST